MGSLSLAEIITLVQSVISSISHYSKQTVCMLRNVCDEIEKLSRNFVWGLNGEKELSFNCLGEGVST